MASSITLPVAPWPGEVGESADGPSEARLQRERALAEAERAVVDELIE